MPIPHYAFGEVQSLYQLAAALSIGLLALETVLDSPIARKRPEFFLLLLQIRKFLADQRAPDLNRVKGKLEALQDRLDADINTNFSNRVTFSASLFNVAKWAGIACALTSVGLLIYSTTNFHDGRAGWEVGVAIFMLVLPLIVTVWVLKASGTVRVQLEQYRSDAERDFLNLVDEGWGLQRQYEDRGQQGASGTADAG